MASTAVEPAEPALPPGYRLHHFDSVDSTNRIAVELASGGSADRTLIWGGEQRSGRGRQGRDWASPRGNLYLSQVVRPTMAPRDYPLFGFAAALAIADLVLSFAEPGTSVSVKWPNDVLVDGGKVAGILIESVAGTDQSWLVVGTGINLNIAPTLPDRKTATISAVAGRAIVVEEALTRFVGAWDARRQTLENDGFEPIRHAWLSLAGSPGSPVTVHQGARRLSGQFGGIGADGALLLDQPDGTRLTVTFGEVSAAS